MKTEVDKHAISKDFNQFSTAAMAMRAQPPWQVVRMASLAICAMTAMALGFAWFAEMDIVVSAQGKVIPTGRSKVIQPLESGIVKAIAVRDGQAVKAGDVLVELDLTNSGADRERLQREVWGAQAEVLRTTAQLLGHSGFKAPSDIPAEIVSNQLAILQSKTAEQRARMASLDADIGKKSADADAISSSLTQLRATLPLVLQKHAMREDLAKTGHIAKAGVIETRMELLNSEKEIAVQGNRLKESQSSHKAAEEQRLQASSEFVARASGERVDATKRWDAATQEFLKAQQRWWQQTLRAPIDGVVQQLAVTTVGGVVTPAQALMTIVPESSTLELEAQVANRDIGHVRLGQRVIVKVETFDFTRYGYLEGEVLWVGTDAVQDPKLGPIFPVRIKLIQTETPTAVNGRAGVVKPGMSITADIRTDKRRLIEYLLAPMLRYKQEALRER